MKWALSDPVRFLHERAEFDRLEGDVDWLAFAWRIDADGTIEVDIDLVVHDITYAGRMTYPDVFPNSPPYIRPRDPSEGWTTHQYGAGGSLCLQWRADNWQTHVTGADIVRNAFELLSTRGVAIFAKAFMSIPAQQAAKTTRPLMPAAAPAVLVTRSLPNRG